VRAIQGAFLEFLLKAATQVLGTRQTKRHDYEIH